MRNNQVIELQDKMEHAQHVIMLMEEFLREVELWDELVLTITKDNKQLFEDILAKYKEIYGELVGEFEKL